MNLFILFNKQLYDCLTDVLWLQCVDVHVVSGFSLRFVLGPT